MAGSIAEFCGFESGEYIQGAMNGAIVVAGAGGHPAHWAPSATRLCHLDEKESVQGDTLTLTDHYAVMLYFRTDNVDEMAASATIAAMICPIDAAVHWSLSVVDGGDVVLRDANNAVIDTMVALLADTWYRIIIAVDLSDSGTISVNIGWSPPTDYNPLATGTYTGQDLKGCAHADAFFKHSSPGTIGATAYNSWLDSWSVYTGLDAADVYEVIAHNFGSPDVEVLPVYAINVETGTPDSGGFDLDNGTVWDNTEDVPSNASYAEYTSKGDTGLCYCDDTDEGPVNDANVTGKIAAMSWLFRVKKLASAGTRLRYGKYDGSTETDTDQTAGTRFAVYDSHGGTYCPDKTEWATLGIAAQAGGGPGSWGARLLHAAALHACNPYPTEVGIGGNWGTGKPVIGG